MLKNIVLMILIVFETVSFNAFAGGTLNWIVGTKIVTSFSGTTAYILYLDRTKIFVSEDFLNSSIGISCAGGCLVAPFMGYKDGRYQSLFTYSGGGGYLNDIFYNSNPTWKDVSEFMANVEIDTPLLITTGALGGTNSLPAGVNCFGASLQDRQGVMLTPPVFNSGGACVSPTHSNESCTFGVSNLYFDYGNLSKSTAVGTSMKKNISLNCSGDSAIQFRMQAGDNIPLSNGMTANLMFNGYGVDKTLNVSSGQNSIDVTSKLEGMPSEMGGFNGAGVVVVFYE